MDIILEPPKTDNVAASVALTNDLELQQTDESDSENLVDENNKLSTLITRLISENSTEIKTLKEQVITTEEFCLNPRIIVEKHGLNNFKLKKYKVICRLCLNESKIDSISLGPMEKDMVKHILPEMKLSISNNPLFCSDCSTSLSSSYNFKISCQKVEETVQNLFDNVKNNEILDLKTHWNPDEGQTVCRVCLKISEEEDCVKLFSSEDDPLKNMMNKCLSNLNTKLTKDPVMCPYCLESLVEQFNFVMQCLDTEEKINFYCEEKDKTADVDLYKVFLFSQCIDEEKDDLGHTKNALECDSQINDADPCPEPQAAHIVSTHIDSATTKFPNNKIDFVNFSEHHEASDFQNEPNISEFDPLGEPVTNNRDLNEEEESLTSTYRSCDKNTEEDDVYVIDRIQSESSDNFEDDDLFEEEEIPNKRPRIEVADNTPYPINIIEAIPLQSLNDFSIEDLSNIPVIDARLNSIAPMLLSENKPIERDHSKDILAQLIDDIDVSDSDQVTDMETSNHFSPCESLEQSEGFTETVKDDEQAMPILTENSLSEIQENRNIETHSPILEATSLSEVQENRNIETKKSENCEVDIKIENITPVLNANSLSEVQENRNIETNKSENCDVVDIKIEDIQNSETLCDFSDTNQTTVLYDVIETDTIKNINPSASGVPKKPSNLVTTLKPAPFKPWLKCNKCTFKTRNIYQLEQHEGAHLLNNSNYLPNQDAFKCPYCDFETKFSENLILHRQLHEMRLVYYCDKPGCKFKTSAKIHLANHKRAHWKRAESVKVMPYSCEKCDFKASNMTNIKHHDRVHQRHKIYKCEICEFKTSHITKFRQHKSVHQRNKHKCEICDFKTSNKLHLKAHQKLHDEEAVKSRMSLRKRQRFKNLPDEPP